MIGTPSRAILLVVAAALAYLLAPGHELGWLTGVPLRPLSLAAVIVLGVVVFACWPEAGSGRTGRAPVLVFALVGLVLLKLGLTQLGLNYGLPGWYYANGRFEGTPERSSDFRSEAATRRDRELHFGGDEFPVHFLNDYLRFNFYGAEAERRRNIPFSVRWQGALYVPRDGTYRLWLTASGPGTLALDGKPIASVDADGRDTRAATLELARGSHEIQVRYARRPPRSSDLKLEWDLDGVRQPVRSPYLLAAPVTPEAWEQDQLVTGGARALDGLFLALLTMVAAWLIAGRVAIVARTSNGRLALLERPLLGLFLLLIFADAALPRLDRVDKLALLGGGQDWLTHETLARDILLSGPLMTLGQPLGEGRTYYAQPFYPYALAAMHWLTGEDQFGVIVLQLFGLGVAGVLLFYLTKRLFGRPAAFAGFVIFLGLRVWHLDWVSRRLLSESIYFVILPALLLCLVRYVDERRRTDLLLGGLLLGLAIVTRGPTLLYAPLVGVLLWRLLRREGEPRRVVGHRMVALFAAASVIVLLVPLRNYAVAGQPALVASSGGVNLQKLHRPTSVVRLSLANDRWYAPYVQDAPTRETLEFIQQDPLGYAATYVPLALYTLGYGAAIDESHVLVWPDLVAMNLLYLGAVVWSRRARSTRAGLLHAFIGVHFLTMVVFAPYDYDNRLVLPMYLPMTAFAGLAASMVLRAAYARDGGLVTVAHAPSRHDELARLR